MRSMLRTLLTLFIAIIFAPAALSQQVYLSGDLAYVTPSNSAIDVSSGFGYSAGAGVTLGDYIALELEYVALGDFSVDGVEAVEDGALNDLGLGAASDASVTGFNTSVLLRWPPNEWDTFYLRAGYFTWENELTLILGNSVGALEDTLTREGSDPMFGIGYAYAPGGSLSLYIEYNRYATEELDIDVIAGGVGYSF